MRIQIQNRYKPFTHLPGAYVLVPFSQYAIHVFPAKIFVYDLFNEDRPIAEIDCILDEPSDSFFTELDLEKGNIIVHGTTSAGTFFRYFVSFDQDKIVFNFTKKNYFQIKRDDNNLLTIQEGKPPSKALSSEKISFGIFKKLNFEAIQDRDDLKEILPLWHAIANQVPHSNAEFSSPSLLTELKSAIERKEKEEVMPLFKALFRTGFQSLLFPKAIDYALLGYKVPPFLAESPLALISEGGKLIRSLLFKYEDGHLDFFPLLPKELSTGRVTGAKLNELAVFDCEWRSGKLTRTALTPIADGDLSLTLPKEIKSFRVRDLRNNTKMKCIPGKPLSLKTGAYLMLDCFIY